MLLAGRSGCDQADGNNRTQAARGKGLRQVRAEISQGTIRRASKAAEMEARVLLPACFSGFVSHNSLGFDDCLQCALVEGAAAVAQDEEQRQHGVLAHERKHAQAQLLAPQPSSRALALLSLGPPSSSNRLRFSVTTAGAALRPRTCTTLTAC